MKKTRKMRGILEQIAEIERMERGKLCRMGERPYLNHQTWENGRNQVRYVRASEVDALQEAIDGYHRYQKLCEEYADEVIKQTRQEREWEKSERHCKRSAKKSKPPKKI
jgi:hypothetical protein